MISLFRLFTATILELEREWRHSWLCRRFQYFYSNFCSQYTATLNLNMIWMPKCWYCASIIKIIRFQRLFWGKITISDNNNIRFFICSSFVTAYFPFHVPQACDSCDANGPCHHEVRHSQTVFTVNDGHQPVVPIGFTNSAFVQDNGAPTEGIQHEPLSAKVNFTTD